MGNHRFVQPPMLLSVRMDVCLENCLNTYTCFQPFGLMPGLVSEHPAEGVYFQSHIRITLQINKDIFGTCITSPASGSTLRRLALIVRVKPLSDTALRA